MAGSHIRANVWLVSVELIAVAIGKPVGIVIIARLILPENHLPLLRVSVGGSGYQRRLLVERLVNALVMIVIQFVVEKLCRRLGETGDFQTGHLTALLPDQVAITRGSLRRGRWHATRRRIGRVPGTPKNLWIRERKQSSHAAENIGLTRGGDSRRHIVPSNAKIHGGRHAVIVVIQVKRHRNADLPEIASAADGLSAGFGRRERR